MASGTGERPVASEMWSISANTTRKLTFATELKSGMIVLGGGTADKAGFYLYGSSSTGNLWIKDILAPTQTGVSVTVSGQVVTIVNGGTGVMRVYVQSIIGAIPALTT